VSFESPFCVLACTTNIVPTEVAQRFISTGEIYTFNENLTFLGKGSKVIIKGDVLVEGNFVSEDAARFHGDVVFRGGVDFQNSPNVPKK